MRIFAVLVLFAILSIPAIAAAEEKGQIYMGTPGAEQLTVAQAKSLPDNTYVTLTGNLISKGENGLYTFRDGSGDIGARINPHLFSGMSVNSHDLVRITGEMDMKDGKDILIDVKQLEAVNK